MTAESAMKRIPILALPLALAPFRSAHAGGMSNSLLTSVLKRNNNGYPIIVADGVEYSQCR